MKSGKIIEGKALNALYNDMRQECIQMSVEGSDTMLVLDELSTLEVSIENPHFKTVSFS